MVLTPGTELRKLNNGGHAGISIAFGYEMSKMSTTLKWNHKILSNTALIDLFQSYSQACLNNGVANRRRL